MHFALIEIVVVLVLWLLFLGLIVTLLVFLVRALRTYIRSHSQPKEPAPDTLGVSRQAVSKWETGESEPTMSNLSALAKTYGVTLAQLLQDVT